MKYSAQTPHILCSLQVWEKSKSDLDFSSMPMGRKVKDLLLSPQQIFLQDANGFIPEFNFKREMKHSAFTTLAPEPKRALSTKVSTEGTKGKGEAQLEKMEKSRKNPICIIPKKRKET